MSIESEEELEGLRAAGRIVRLALEAMEAAVCPGVTTAEIDAVAARVLREHGARHAPRHILGFPGDSCISVNEEAVHGVPGDRVIQAGDLVKLDIVVEKDGFMADAAVTVGVPPVTAMKRRLVECARAAFDQAMLVASAGRGLNEIGRAVEREVRRQGFSVMPGLSGHGIGRDMHEPPAVLNYYDWRQRQVLAEGMVITVEPIVCAGSGDFVEAADGWTLRTADRTLSAHHEHTILITRGAPLLLTAA